MRTRFALTILVALVVATLAFAQTQGKGPGATRMRATMVPTSYVEQSWAALCFEVGISNDQIAKLKPTYVWAYKARNSALKTAREKRDFADAGKTMDYIKKTLDERIVSQLSATQKTAWQKWQTELSQRRQKAREAMQGALGGHGRPQGQHAGQK